MPAKSHTGDRNDQAQRFALAVDEIDKLMNCQTTEQALIDVAEHKAGVVPVIPSPKAQPVMGIALAYFEMFERPRAFG
jgi:hypothetical protein